MTSYVLFGFGFSHKKKMLESRLRVQSYEYLTRCVYEIKPNEDLLKGVCLDLGGTTFAHRELFTKDLAKWKYAATKRSVLLRYIELTILTELIRDGSTYFADFMSRIRANQQGIKGSVLNVRLARLYWDVLIESDHPGYYFEELTTLVKDMDLSKQEKRKFCDITVELIPKKVQRTRAPAGTKLCKDTTCLCVNDNVCSAYSLLRREIASDKAKIIPIINMERIIDYLDSLPEYGCTEMDINQSKLILSFLLKM
jgi:hypothetical protein